MIIKRVCGALCAAKYANSQPYVPQTLIGDCKAEDWAGRVFLDPVDATKIAVAAKLMKGAKKAAMIIGGRL
jgi:hypothetical protein